MQGCMSGMLGNGAVELCKGLKQLKEEHPPLLNMLDSLLELSTKIRETEQKEDAFKQLVNEVEDFILDLEPHSDREEEILFPMMVTYIGKEMGPIAVMEYEHDQAKSLLGKFINSTRNIEQLSSEQMVELAELVKNANYILVDHFSKEENILFPMAQNLLSDEEKELLLEKINFR